MNEHIELVEKWLADPLSVSQAELKANDHAANAAANAANNAASSAAHSSLATKWVSEYHKSVKEKRL